MPPLKNFRGLLLLPLALLAGCDMVLLNASGDIARQQGQLIVVSTILMLLIIVPVIALTILFAWRYRQNNKEANYSPDWDHSTELELAIWGAPLLIIIALGAITWISTHTLDPYRPLRRIEPGRPVPAEVKPLTVEVVALDWKWLFIYPEQGIATVNELAAPVDRPILFKITASSVMNSFFIPALAGQIYAMPGMETKLNAVINKPGDFEGFSANYSGAGFSGMRFRFHGVSDADFATWVQKAKSAGGELSRAAYMELERPSERDPVRRFGTVAPDLYKAIVNRCVDRNKMCMDQMMAIDAEGGLGKVGSYNVSPRAWQPEASIPPRTYVTAMCSVNDPAGLSLPLSTARIREE
ncbi:ubiquinol oxidase subunit II [Variovorax saccharolyticus]|uniref:ubiquinol oxidase subunit II n=1 Tax=Variovorax saccharolyticus TaxID=3053516 RepID=UPI0025776C07|nr:MULTISPECIES: ubiquinol oxidase subunit II [unclassified Variovorax]MDM0016158.1 ubiquinol oxidase subunit II [Variovorax sp. J22R187]MDM0027089.1 ubiquinol oxidase subunit II [Variovorax sp. J31P216]